MWTASEEQTVTMPSILYIGEDYMDVLADGAWEKIFKVKPEVFTSRGETCMVRSDRQMWHLDPMHSSHLEITSNVLIRAA